MKLSRTSLQKLKGVHPDLVRVVKRAIKDTNIDFTVLEGLRSVERQRELVKKGASKTMNSRHLTGHAIDLAPLVDGKVSWDWPLYYKLEKVIKKAAKDEGVVLEWGGDWKSFKDGPHWQLPFSKYPKTQKFVAQVDDAEEYTLETDTQARTKALAVGGASVATSSTIAVEPLLKATEVLVEQQGELSSGDYFRIAIAVLIIVSAGYFAWKKLS